VCCPNDVHACRYLLISSLSICVIHILPLIVVIVIVFLSTTSSARLPSSARVHTHLSIDQCRHESISKQFTFFSLASSKFLFLSIYSISIATVRVSFSCSLALFLLHGRSLCFSHSHSRCLLPARVRLQCDVHVRPSVKLLSLLDYCIS
jgi:hypothetical protein